MSARTPQDVYPLLVRAINSGDKDAMLALYTDDPVMRFAPDQLARGQAAVSAALDAFLAPKGTMEVKVAGVVEGPATAIVYASWRLTGTDEEGAPVVLGSGESVDLLSKQSDGTWLIAIDDGYGAASNPDVPLLIA